MSTELISAPLDSELLCYCVALTFGELRAGLRTGSWPPAGRELAGKLCTGCMGDLLYCVRTLGGQSRTEQAP
jgi:hypothetical protein